MVATRRMEAQYEELAARVRRTEEGQMEILRRLDALLQNQQNENQEDEGRRRNEGNHDGGSQGSESEVERAQGRIRRGDHQGRRLELPIFEGVDAYGWLNKVERYFLINAVREEEKLVAVLVVLEGEALNWFQWWEINTGNATWDIFRSELLNRFQPEMVDNPMRSLLTLKQTRTVTEFRKEFERVVSPLRYEDEDLLRGVWLNGLCDSVREELLMHPTIRLSEMIKMSLKIERRNLAWETEGTTRPGRGGEEDQACTTQAGPRLNDPTTMAHLEQECCRLDQELSRVWALQIAPGPR